MDFGFQGASCWRGPLRNPEHVLFPESVCRNVSVCHFGLGLLFAFYFFLDSGPRGHFLRGGSIWGGKLLRFREHRGARVPSTIVANFFAFLLTCFTFFLAPKFAKPIHLSFFSRESDSFQRANTFQYSPIVGGLVTFQVIIRGVSWMIWVYDYKYILFSLVISMLKSPSNSFIFIRV